MEVMTWIKWPPRVHRVLAAVKPNGGDDIGAVHGIFETWTRHDAFPWNFFSPFFLQVSFKVELGGVIFSPFFAPPGERERERERKGLGAVVATGVERFFTDSFLFIISQLSISFHVSWFIPLSFSLYLFFVLFSSFRDFFFFNDSLRLLFVSDCCLCKCFSFLFIFFLGVNSCVSARCLGLYGCCNWLCGRNSCLTLVLGILYHVWFVSWFGFSSVYWSVFGG